MKSLDIFVSDNTVIILITIVMLAFAVLATYINLWYRRK